MGLVSLACALSTQPPVVRLAAALCLSTSAMILTSDHTMFKHKHILLLSLYLAFTGWEAVASVAVVFVGEVLVVAAGE